MRRRARPRIVLALLAFGLVAGSLWLYRRTHPVTAYQIVDLGIVPGATGSEAGAINDAGQVTGQVDGFPRGSGSESRAFLWQNGALTELGTLPGLPRLSDSALNNHERIVGGCETGFSESDVAFVFAGGRMKRLPPPPGCHRGHATAINDLDQVVGTTYTQTGDRRAFLYAHGSARSLGMLGTLGIPNGRAFESDANGINNGGQITGESDATDNEEGTSHAFLYSRGKMMDLGTLPGRTNSVGNAINGQGQVVGFSWNVGANEPGSSRAFLWRSGTMINLGTLPGYAESEAFGLNGRGQVVGIASGLLPLQRFLRTHFAFGSSAAVPWSHPFLYQNGRMTDINDLIAADSGWVLESAGGINDKGQIVGTGKHNGKTRAFVLTPIGLK